MDRPSRFSVRTEEDHSSARVVVVSGDVDLGTAPDFEDELGRSVEQQLGSALALVTADPRVTMMLEVTRLDRVLRSYATRDEALAAVGSA